MLRRGDLVAGRRQGPASLPGRGRVLPARPAQGGPRPRDRQPPGGRAGPARRAGRRPSARRARAHRRPTALQPDPPPRAAAGAAVPAAGDRRRGGAALPAPHRLDPPRHQAEQRHHGRARAADRPLGRPARGGRAAAAPPDRHRRLHVARAVRPDGAGEGVPSHASDVWGLGATLFHAVAGHRPFAHGDPDAGDVRLRFPQLVEAPAPLPDDVPGGGRRGGRGVPASRTPTTGRCRTRWRRRWSRCSPACRAARWRPSTRGASRIRG